MTELEQQALTLPEQAQGICIRDEATYRGACDLLLAIKDLRNEVEAHHRPIIDAAHRAHKAAIDGLRRIDDPLKQAESDIKPKIATWEDEQKRIVEEAQRKAEEEQRRRMEEEIEAAVVQAEAEGASVEEIQAIIAQPIVVSAVPALRAFAPVKGISARELWSAKVIDIRLLCKAVADGKVSPEYVLANMAALNARARAERQTMCVPGVQAVRSTSVAAGRR